MELDYVRVLFHAVPKSYVEHLMEHPPMTWPDHPHDLGVSCVSFGPASNDWDFDCRLVERLPSTSQQHHCDPTSHSIKASKYSNELRSRISQNYIHIYSHDLNQRNDINHIHRIHSWSTSINCSTSDLFGLKNHCWPSLGCNRAGPVRFEQPQIGTNRPQKGLVPLTIEVSNINLTEIVD